MRKVISTLLSIVVFSGIALADINFGGGGSYNSDTKKAEYSLLFEYLTPIVPNTLKIGAGAQYFTSGNDFDFDIRNVAYMPVYLVARANVPLVPIISSFFVTGRLGYTILMHNGNDPKDGGRYYAVGIGKQILAFLYIEGVYTVYHWNKYNEDDDRFSINFGISL